MKTQTPLVCYLGDFGGGRGRFPAKPVCQPLLRQSQFVNHFYSRKLAHSCSGLCVSNRMEWQTLSVAVEKESGQSEDIGCADEVHRRGQQIRKISEEDVLSAKPSVRSGASEKPFATLNTQNPEERERLSSARLLTVKPRFHIADGRACTSRCHRFIEMLPGSRSNQLHQRAASRIVKTLTFDYGLEAALKK